MAKNNKPQKGGMLQDSNSILNTPDMKRDSMMFRNNQIGFGTSRDRRAYSYVAEPYTFSNRQELDSLYHGNDVAGRVVDVPVREMLRAGWSLLFQKDPDGKKARKVEQYLSELNVKSTLRKLLTQARLYGTAALFIGADEGRYRDLSNPLRLDDIKTIKFLRVIDRFDLNIHKTYTNVGDAKYGEPEVYVFQPRLTAQPVAIHESRLIVLDGTTTSQARKTDVNNGWADSIFVKILGVLRGYDASWTAAETLMQDFAQAVIKIQGLADMMATHGEDKVAARMQLIDLQRSVLRAVMLDEHEEFSRQGTPMTGLPELLDRWMHRVAAAADMPITLLFGTSPGGMNATGSSDIQFFYDSIAAKQEEEVAPTLRKLLNVLLRAQDNPLKGKMPDNWTVALNPLERLSPLDLANLHKTQAEADALYLDREVLSAKEVAQSRFGSLVYSQETTLDIEARLTLEEARQEEAQPTTAPDGDHMSGLSESTPAKMGAE